jgi:hypothetical protein
MGCVFCCLLAMRNPLIHSNSLAIGNPGPNHPVPQKHEIQGFWHVIILASATAPAPNSSLTLVDRYDIIEVPTTQNIPKFTLLVTLESIPRPWQDVLQYYYTILFLLESVALSVLSIYFPTLFFQASLC